MTPEILRALEPGQASDERHAPYPRKDWGPRVRLLLWLLRLYVVLAVPLVIYAFAKTALH